MKGQRWERYISQRLAVETPLNPRGLYLAPSLLQIVRRGKLLPCVIWKFISQVTETAGDAYRARCAHPKESSERFERCTLSKPVSTEHTASNEQPIGRIHVQARWADSDADLEGNDSQVCQSDGTLQQSKGHNLVLVSRQQRLQKLDVPAAVPCVSWFPT